MSCAKHGWTLAAPCIDCLDEKKQENQGRDRFVMNAAIYFFDNRTYPGISKEAAEALRMRCWTDAIALYETGQKLPLKVSVDTKE